MYKTLKRILSVSGKHKKRVYFGVVCSFFNACFNSISILAVLLILINIDSLKFENIILSFKLLLISLAGKAVLKYLMNCFLSASGYIVFRDKRVELGDKLKKAPMGYFSEKNLGTINNTITSSMSDLENFSMMAVENVIGGTIQSFMIALFLMYFDWRLGLVSIIGLILAMLVLTLIQKRASELTPIRNKALAKTVDSVISFIRGISVVKLFGVKKEESINRTFEQYEDACIQLEKKVMGLNGLFRGILEVSSCCILLCTSLLMFYNQMTFAIGVMFIVSAFMIYGQVEVMGNGAFLMQLLGDAFDKMDEVYNVSSIKDGDDKIGLKLDIELKNVYFKYDKKDIIKNVSVKIPEKSSLAIVGYSGSGKTTLCNLMVRFWDIYKGEILLGEKNIKKYKIEQLMDKFSMVFQNVYLFNDTVENNIKFGNKDATHEEVVNAAKKACCHKFIEELPMGYDTIIGEGGSNFSGGEKQRISIARAILKDAPIVILDEATSSVDPENEFELLSAIQKLTQGKTLITIAHRMSTIKNADQIIVMDEGEIVQNGTHKKLVDEDGIYKKFLNIHAKSGGWVISS